MTNRFSVELRKGKNDDIQKFKLSLLGSVNDSIRKNMCIDVESELDRIETEWFGIKSIANNGMVADSYRMPPFFNNTHVTSIFKCDDYILDRKGNGMIAGVYYMTWTQKIWTPNGLDTKYNSTDIMCVDLFVKDWITKNIEYHEVGHEVGVDEAVKTLLIPSNELQRSYDILSAMGARYFHQPLTFVEGGNHE